MTHNTIQYLQNLENARHNEAMETENRRNNQEIERLRAGELDETRRANLKHEELTAYQNALEAKDLERKSKDSAVQRKNTAAATKLTKAQAKSTKAQTKLTKSEVKTERSKRKTQAVERAATKAKVAQGWESLAIQRLQAAASRMQAKASMKKSKADAQKVENDLLIAAFKDPKLLTYLGLTGKSEAGEDIHNAVLNAADISAKTGKSFIETLFEQEAIKLSIPANKILNVKKKITNAAKDIVGEMTGTATSGGGGHAFGKPSSKTKSKSKNKKGGK